MHSGVQPEPHVDPGDVPVVRLEPYLELELSRGPSCVLGGLRVDELAISEVISRERTIMRKIKEFILALQIERKYSKDEILQMYLNEAPYGGQAYGVQAASEVYFGKNIQDITLAEAALLAGLPQAPSRYSPYNDPELAEGRKDYVLHLMATRGWLGNDGQKHYLPKEAAQTAHAKGLMMILSRPSPSHT